MLQRAVIVRTANLLLRKWSRAGERMHFYATTLACIPEAIVKYRTEVLRQVAQLGLGIGLLAAIGGSVVIVGSLTATTGMLVGVQGYNQFQAIGTEALTGAASAFFNPRVIQQGTITVALAATIGAATTAEIGAMRINEEVDALEVMGIRTITYLASTRVIGGLISVVPIWCIGMITAYGAARLSTVYIYGQSGGVYDHYFDLFLHPADLFWSLGIIAAITLVIMLIHTYHGYTAAGGPSGVGEAVGVAVRTSMAVASLAIVLMILAVYGTDGNIHLAG
ncbi:ABC transporter permease [Mycobacterium sp. SMC-19]|uniref:ABC transporter permease n=1 Tax=Mycobacterium sp. SMC-19 TaxID=3381630 RepID=UPI003877630B